MSNDELIILWDNSYNFKIRVFLSLFYYTFTLFSPIFYFSFSLCILGARKLELWVRGDLQWKWIWKFNGVLLSFLFFHNLVLISNFHFCLIVMIESFMNSMDSLTDGSILILWFAIQFHFFLLNIISMMETN